MAAEPAVFYTPEQYLDREREATHKSEYFGGEIFAMAGGSFTHTVIKDNVVSLVNTKLKGKGCRGVGSDLRLHVQKNGLYTYPDAMVICGGVQYWNFRSDTITNPTLIVEVLSPGTEAYDRGDKFKLYRGIPTFTEYLMVNSQKMQAEVFRKGEHGFWYLAEEADTAQDTITLDSIGLTLAVADLYADTEL